MKSDFHWFFNRMPSCCRLIWKSMWNYYANSGCHHCHLGALFGFLSHTKLSVCILVSTTFQSAECYHETYDHFIYCFHKSLLIDRIGHLPAGSFLCQCNYHITSSVRPDSRLDGAITLQTPEICRPWLSPHSKCRKGYWHACKPHLSLFLAPKSSVKIFRISLVWRTRRPLSASTSISSPGMSTIQTSR